MHFKISQLICNIIAYFLNIISMYYGVNFMDVFKYVNAYFPIPQGNITEESQTTVSCTLLSGHCEIFELQDA